MPTRRNCERLVATSRAARLPVDAELRPAASGHAHHAAAGAEARRRDAWSTPCPTSAICTRGFEKIGEHLNYNQYVTVTDRMNYISPMANNVAWHGAVEKLLGLELTPRCKYIRTIIAELARISDHLLCNGAVGLDTGAFTYFLVRLLPARSAVRHLRDAVRRRLHQQLHARRRPDVRRHAAGDREDPRRSCKTFPRRSTTWSGC